jgi:membrane protein required for colicin V production
MNFPAIDIIFILLITLFIIRCYLKGFINEVFPMAGFVLGLLVALFFYKNGGAFIRAKFMNGVAVIPEIIAFIFLFFFIFLFIKLLEKLLSDVIYNVELDSADRFLGVLFGLAEGIAVISLILFLLRIQPLFDASSILSDSVFARFLLPIITGRRGVGDV